MAAPQGAADRRVRSRQSGLFDRDVRQKHHPDGNIRRQMNRWTLRDRGGHRVPDRLRRRAAGNQGFLLDGERPKGLRRASEWAHCGGRVPHRDRRPQSLNERSRGRQDKTLEIMLIDAGRDRFLHRVWRNHDSVGLERLAAMLDGLDFDESRSLPDFENEPIIRSPAIGPVSASRTIGPLVSESTARIVWA